MSLDPITYACLTNYVCSSVDAEGDGLSLARARKHVELCPSNKPATANNATLSAVILNMCIEVQNQPLEGAIPMSC